MNHDITITADVLLEVICSCGERLMNARSAPLELIEKIKWEHLFRVDPPVEWKELAEGKYIHGICDLPGCIWCDRLHENRESCD